MKSKVREHPHYLDLLAAVWSARQVWKEDLETRSIAGGLGRTEFDYCRASADIQLLFMANLDTQFKLAHYRAAFEDTSVSV